jgi:hypothetical protein
VMPPVPTILLFLTVLHEIGEFKACCLYIAVIPIKAVLYLP